MESKPNNDEENVGSDVAQQEGNAGSEYDDHELNTIDTNKLNREAKNITNGLLGEIDAGN